MWDMLWMSWLVLLCCLMWLLTQSVRSRLCGSLIFSLGSALLMGAKLSNPFAMVQGSRFSLSCSWMSRAVISRASRYPQMCWSASASLMFFAVVPMIIPSSISWWMLLL